MIGTGLFTHFPRSDYKNVTSTTPDSCGEDFDGYGRVSSHEFPGHCCGMDRSTLTGFCMHVYMHLPLPSLQSPFLDLRQGPLLSRR